MYVRSAEGKVIGVGRRSARLEQVTNDEQGMGQIKEICGNAGADIGNGLETGTFPVSV